jgi:hypothetical protein
MIMYITYCFYISYDSLKMNRIFYILCCKYKFQDLATKIQQYVYKYWFKGILTGCLRGVNRDNCLIIRRVVGICYMFCLPGALLPPNKIKHDVKYVTVFPVKASLLLELCVIDCVKIFNRVLIIF